MVGFALETTQEQLRQGRNFVLDAPEDTSLWSSDAWAKVCALSQVSVRQLTGENRRVASNFAWDFDLPGFSQGSIEIASEDLSHDELRHDDHVSEESEEEMLAHRLLEQGDFSQASCLKLLRSIKWPSTSRRTRRQCVGDSSEVHLLGQYSYGKFSGMTLATYKLRNTARYLNRFMDAHGAAGPRSSLSIGHNVHCGNHRDLNNLGRNYSVALGKFSGGKLWTEDEHGNVSRKVGKDSHAVVGKLQAYKNRMVDFDACKWHGVEEWRGDRWTITGFQTRSAADLTPLQEQHLRDYGFSPGTSEPTTTRHDHFAEWISTGSVEG